MRKIKDFFETADFITDFRKASNVWVCLVAFLIILPFSINSYFQGRIVIGIVSSALVLFLALNAWSVLRGKFYPTAVFVVMTSTVTAAVILMLFKQGIIGVLWAYPGILSFYFLFKERQAWVAN